MMEYFSLTEKRALYTYEEEILNDNSNLTNTKSEVLTSGNLNYRGAVNRCLLSRFVMLFD